MSKNDLDLYSDGSENKEPIHSKTGASSMYRWSNCPGSVALSATVPKGMDSEFAALGTLAHDYGAKLLLKIRGQIKGKVEIPEGLEADSVDAVMVYVNYIKGFLNNDPDAVLQIEHSFDMGEIYPGLFGTADCVIYHPKPKLLRVIDYKNGAGIPVEVFRNLQGLYYGLGALTTLGYPCEEVEITIVQPRCNHSDGPIRSWRLPSLEMFDFQSDLIAAVKETEKPDAKLSSGDHCQFCDAHAVCPEKFEKAKALAKLDFVAIDKAKGYTPEQVAEALEWAPKLESWAKAVRAFAYSEALQGRTPVGFKLVNKKANRKWIDEKKVKTALKRRKVTDKEMHAPNKLKSPKQMESLFVKEDRKFLEKLYSKDSSGTTLADDSDPRKEITNDPKDDFKKIE